jgi:hypothetical protein
MSKKYTALLKAKWINVIIQNKTPRHSYQYQYAWPYASKRNHRLFQHVAWYIALSTTIHHTPSTPSSIIMSNIIYFKQRDSFTAFIDRTFPDILSGKMSEDEWTAFCNRIDNAYCKPNEEMMRLLWQRLKLTAKVTLCLLLAIILSTVFIQAAEVSIVLFVLIFLIITFPFNLYLHVKRDTLPRRRKIIDDIGAILTDETNKRTDVSVQFSMPPDKFYIECSIAAPGAGNGTAGAGGDKDANTMEQGLGSQQVEMPTATSAGSSEQAAPSELPSTSIFSSLQEAVLTTQNTNNSSIH